MPQLSDLRESGAIEQDADMVCFLYRPEYYEITTNEMGESNKGETHVRIAKHRNGQLDTIKLRAVLEFQRFEDDGSVENPGGGGSSPFAGMRNHGGGGGDEAKLYIQKGSKMNDMDFEDEGLEDAPF
jgi:replicative DNA helicase